jgi:hypothetical protein
MNVRKGHPVKKTPAVKTPILERSLKVAIAAFIELQSCAN